MVSCLVQVMANRYFRTLHGFQELIEREWVALGYDFTNRLGLLVGSELVRNYTGRRRAMAVISGERESPFDIRQNCCKLIWKMS